MPVAYDVAVLGLGAMGAAATYQLARRGAKVLGIDRYSPPHEFGSTHGDTRITRIACGEGPEYTAFAVRSHQVWRELEAELGVDLFTQNGLLVIFGPGRRAANHGVSDFRGATVAAAKQAKLDYEMLDTAGIRARYPALNVADGDEAYHDTVGGFVRPERCVAAQLQRAKALGADLHLNEKVISFDQTGGSVTVTTDKGTYVAKELIVAAGPCIRRSGDIAGFLASGELRSLGGVLDVAPTLLALLGIPRSREMPGAAIAAILDGAAGVNAKLPAVATHDEGFRPPSRTELPPEMERNFQERFKALGYIGSEDEDPPKGTNPRPKR
jgi:glycine/D-amino acid oxidase-like deaminating enzyme